ncbi:MAG: TonB-dependent receptor [Sediminibacterium sp.]|nr:TonB-dependent receptor [Sediminibacterium sp.]
MVDANTREPLVGATAKLGDVKTMVFVKLDGTFLFSKQKPGTYKISVSYEGYKKLMEKMVTVSESGTQTVDFNLESLTTELTGIQCLFYRFV